jgi:hypothetical protein
MAPSRHASPKKRTIPPSSAKCPPRPIPPQPSPSPLSWTVIIWTFVLGLLFLAALSVGTLAWRKSAAAAQEPKAAAEVSVTQIVVAPAHPVPAPRVAPPTKVARTTPPPPPPVIPAKPAVAVVLPPPPSAGRVPSSTVGPPVPVLAKLALPPAGRKLMVPAPSRPQTQKPVLPAPPPEPPAVVAAAPVEQKPALPPPPPEPPPAPEKLTVTETVAARTVELAAPAPELRGPAIPECDNYGTAVAFLPSPRDAAQRATKEGKLLFTLHVSGNFEDPGFT